MSKKVMVTGATGYVTGWIIKKLLEQGHTVHAAVRNPNDEKKINHLLEMEKNSSSKLNFFKADLLEEGSYKEAMQTCEIVFHTASPFLIRCKRPSKRLN